MPSARPEPSGAEPFEPGSFRPDRTEFYLGDPDAAFARARAADPLPWYEEGGFWCVLTHADLQQVSRTPRVFSSTQGTQLFEIALRRGPGPGALVSGDQAPSIIRMDPPEHNLHRKLVIQAFTPRTVQALEARIRQITRKSLDVIPRGEVVDYVEHVAVPMPMLVIAELIGVPSEDHRDFRRWSDAMIEAGGGGVTPETVETISELHGYFVEMIEARRRAPRDDLIGVLLEAEIEGKRLDIPQIVMFLLTLLVAGNETTRNLVSRGSSALLDHPDQWRALRADPTLVPNAVEEMLRWVSPVRTFCRRAVQATRLRDKDIAAGDYMVLFYGAANRDPAVFGADAEAFDITRRDAPRHVAFGFGEHLCLGASLARLEGRVMFEELVRAPSFERAGEPELLPSVLMNGLVRMPVIFEGDRAAR